MSDAQAGTSEPKQDDTPKGGTPAAAADGSGNDEQKWKEALVWKQKAEEFNKVKADKDVLEQRLAEMERLAYSRGAGQATDPAAEMVNALREQAQYDPVAKAQLYTMQRTAVLEAEAYLTSQLLGIPEAKRDKVAALVRASNYQMSIDGALNLVTDPDSGVARQRLAELEAENARLKERVQPNGASPAMTVPADSAGDTREQMPWSEVQHVLKLGGERARALRDKMDSGKLKVDYRA